MDGHAAGPFDAAIDASLGSALVATTNFAGSPRNKYGTHGSKGFKGDYAAAWRCHFSKIGGGKTDGASSGPIRGTVRRTEMIAAAMKPPCNLPGTDAIGARGGSPSPLSCTFPEKPSDYGLSAWATPGDDKLAAEDIRLTCSDLAVIKRAALAEIKRRASDREKVAKKDARELTSVSTVAMSAAVTRLKDALAAPSDSQTDVLGLIARLNRLFNRVDD